ncbi:MAG: hypothetical protein WCL38_01865 [Actinomycetota bacterium]
MARRSPRAKQTFHKGRVTPKSGEHNTKVGRYKTPEESGRVTAAIPNEVRHSPPWWGKASLSLLVGGLLVMLGNWMTLWPGSYTPWYLLVGLVLSGAGFGMLTRYH